MAKKSRFKNKAKKNVARQKRDRFLLPPETTRTLWGVFLVLTATLITLSFFQRAGIAGAMFMNIAIYFVGRTIFTVPLLLILAAITLWNSERKHFLFPIFFALFLAIIGVDGILGALAIQYDIPTKEAGGLLGYVLSYFPVRLFGMWGGLMIFVAVIAGGVLVARQLMARERGKEEKQEEGVSLPMMKKIFTPKFELKELPRPSVPPPVLQPSEKTNRQHLFSSPKSDKDEFQIKQMIDDGGFRGVVPGALQKQQQQGFGSSWKSPPLSLLDAERGEAQSGDIKVNSAIIKRTLENFGIPVEISEVNIGPTVTQYALKPAEGVKLSKIVALSNDLALSLAAHPVRIEAPIPGRPIVGIEVPNRVRAQVRLRNLLEQPSSQQSSSSLVFAVGRDVAGNPTYADLARMPHLLIAGSTGTGKTIGLNALIVSLLYKNSPDLLRFILIDPKRVEFPVYNGLPHLLTPVIYDPHKTVNALKWLIGEMERRFDVLASVKARDIAGYNALMLKESKEMLPYIVLAVDELADLMAARGRDIEAGIVRLAQMARAVGIHLVVATQRPSVEVITGLIKANITSRIAFQVASQVDSRTILDAAGAEKLLGAGDMLFISSEMSKPRRLQGAYVSEKEVRRVVKFIKEQEEQKEAEGEEHIAESLAEDLEKQLAADSSSFDAFGGGEEDPLYEEAKKLVIETRKASASFLQRRLRIGYARAARLIDILETKGVVGPGEGAKPREVLMGVEGRGDEEDNEWEEKV